MLGSSGTAAGTALPRLRLICWEARSCAGVLQGAGTGSPESGSAVRDVFWQALLAACT